MTTLLYHGSNSDFSEFQINEALLKTKKCNLAEGLGVYLATNPEFTESYGNILYTVEVEDEDILDFTEESTFATLFNKIRLELGFEVSNYIDVGRFVLSVINGQISVHNLNKELENLLESNESFYLEFENQITYEDDCLFTRLENLFNEFLTPVFAYHDHSFKQKIFICVKDPNVLSIKSKKERA